MNTKTYGVVQTDKIEAYQAGRIHHVRLSKETQNGELIVAGDVEAENLDVREGVIPTDGVGAVALIAEPVKTYDESTRLSRMENQFVMQEDKVARAYKLVPTDMFSVTKEVIENPEALEGFEAGTTVKYATLGANGLHKIVDDAPEEGYYAKVVNVIQKGGRYAYMGGVPATEYVLFDVKAN